MPNKQDEKSKIDKKYNKSKGGKISIEFIDGSKKNYDHGVTATEIIENDIGIGLLKPALVAKINNKVIDLNKPIDESGKLKILTFKDKEGVDVFRHSTAHVMAHAVKRLFPKVKPTIGPNVEEGFYYDFDKEDPFTPDDLANIEAEMRKIVDQDNPFVRKDISKDEAKEIFKNNSYKLELIDELEDETVSIYEEGDFVDLCRGPHIASTKKISAFKLTKVAGAYWRGDANSKQLQRVYGISFFDKKDLQNYLIMLEEAEKRDHRKLGSDLDLIYFHEFSPGAPFYLNKGAIIYNILIDFIREEYRKRGYEEVITPQLYNKKLWEISGHWEHYKEDMFIINIEGQEHSLKPMNCPSHCLIYNRKIKSYRQLPVRIADFCNLHRNELSGTLAGMFRVRKFAQDDGHIFCRFDQIEEEVLGVLDFIEYVWTKVFNFKLKYYLSTRPEKALGTKEIWDKSEELLKEALKKAKIEYEVKEGEGAFYGPKIDIDIEDALGRKWQCPTCQLDFNLPNRFKNLYEGSDGKKHEAVMIHRAILGSLERFIGIMIEHYAGKFPLWLSPIQVRIVTIADRFNEFAEQVKEELESKGIRIELDKRSESLSYKIRDAQVQKINYICVIGEREVESKTINLRSRDNKVLGAQKVDTFVNDLLAEINNKE
ncbi:MAG: threonine--tRNA ligase [Candidatus Woesearchaeota archaeon]